MCRLGGSSDPGSTESSSISFAQPESLTAFFFDVRASSHPLCEPPCTSHTFQLSELSIHSLP